MPIDSITKYGLGKKIKNQISKIKNFLYFIFDILYLLTGDGFFGQYTPSLKGEDFEKSEKGVMAQPHKLPIAFTLLPNMPNPFIKKTSIRWQIPKRSKVSLKIYDITGRIVRVLLNEVKEPRYYINQWDGKDQQGRDLSQGVYFYRLKTEGFEDIKKTVLLR